jgi:hypothetical protein
MIFIKKMVINNGPCSTNQNPKPNKNGCPDDYYLKKNKYGQDCCYKKKKTVKQESSSKTPDKPESSSKTPQSSSKTPNKPESSSKTPESSSKTPQSSSKTPNKPESSSKTPESSSKTPESSSKTPQSSSKKQNQSDFKHTNSNHDVSPNAYVVPNDPKFSNWITTTFIDYKKQNTSDEDVSCDMKVERLNLFPHQRFIRDYLQYKSPYRGLLVYHGLGVGKSCSSIAAAEMLQNYKQVVIMLPASLRSNYINEIIKCGNKYYNKKLFHWTFLKDGVVNYVSNKTLEKNKGVWVIDEAKQPNFDKLTDEEHVSLDLQIIDVLKTNYTFVNYNGVSEKNIKELYVDTGYFDNKVVIIDEVHNFISGVSNKSKITGALYTILMQSKNIKLILLSGTPIINTPNEIAYTINLIKGYEYIYSLEFQESNETSLTTILDNIPEIDSYQIELLINHAKVHISLVPNLFKKAHNNKVSFNDITTATDEEIIDKIIRTFETKEIKFVKQVVNKYTPLPTASNEFNKYFIDETDFTMTNKNLFMRRILGSVSYFVNNDPRLYPTMENVYEELDMSDYQYEKYVNARKEEKKLEKQKSTSLFGNQVSVYKTYSRNICNFVFPENINRPKPKDIKDLANNKKKEEYTKQVNAALDKLSNNDLSKDLHKYSPKFKKMIENVHLSKGNVLIYSQFSTVEGIEIISRCLALEGYGEMKIVYANGEWDIEYDRNKQCFTKFKSDLNLDEKHKNEYNNILLGIYNNEFDQLPNQIKQKLKGKNNLRGDILKILFITQSGAEGISLKNVRQVHITEPYWNKNRIDQVIGRANRTCSHIALPKAERNFTVYSYAMKMTTTQLKLKENIIRIYDKNITTDQFIYNIAKNKHNIISEFLECMKKASVDCSLNNPEVGCFSFPVDLIENKKAYTFDINKDRLDVYMNNATVEIKKKAMKITWAKTNESYIFILDTNELFDYNLYVTTGVLNLVGHMKMLENKKYAITFIQ